jgi:DNA end-binding protein Ku
MPARAYWSGQIRFSLVSIPVEVFSATKSGSRISFNQIHEPCGKRIRYEKVVPGLGPVDPDEIVKGYEVEKWKYVLLSDEEMDEVKLEAKHTIDLVHFVDRKEIDPIYFDRPFFVAPDDDNVAGEAYVVLRDALRKSGKVGLGQIVAQGRSSVISLGPCGDGLIVEMLRYQDEIRKSETFFADVPDEKPEKELLDLADELIDRKSGPFEPEVFKDSYELALRELIEAKRKKRKPREFEEPKIGSNVVDLMEALKRSVGKKAETQDKTKATKKQASRRRSRTSKKISKRKTSRKSSPKSKAA